MLLNPSPVTDRSNLILPLDHITASDAGRVGGKAYNCARLKQAGLPVPDGVAITIDAADDADALSTQLGPALDHFPTDARFAVRSSAADEDGADHSFAGIHDTKLNVAHVGVLDAIQACWASVHSPTALAYRRTQGLPAEQVDTGVLIQLMIQPVMAGVAFTIDPMTGRNDELLISAAWGLGEAIVSGQVEPDVYRVTKRDGAVLSTHIGEKRCRVLAHDGVSRLVETDDSERHTPTMTPDQLRELAGLLTQIEHEYGVPQDVEWCHDGGQFWIVQSRPVTAIATASGTDLEWTRANLREVLPDLPSPQNSDIVCDLLDHATRQFYGNLLAPEEVLGPLCKSFYGRPYLNLSQLRYLSQRVGQPPAAMMRGWGHAEAITDADEVVVPQSRRESISALPSVLRMMGQVFTARRHIRRQFALVDDNLNQLGTYRPEMLSDVDLIDLAKQHGGAMEASIDIAILISAGISVFSNMLKASCARAGASVQPWLQAHLASGQKTVSAQQGFDLLALANTARRDRHTQHYFLHAADAFSNYREALQKTAFLEQFDHFLMQYGHRGPHESDLAIPRYHEHPTPLLQAIREHVRAPSCPSPEAIMAQQARDADTARRTFETQLSPWQRRTLLPRVRWLLRRLKQWYLWRERNRFEAIRVGGEIRQWHLVLAQRFVDRGWIETRDDYFFLLMNEIESVAANPERGSEMRASVTERRSTYATWQQLQMPLYMRESELPMLIRRANAALPHAGVKQLFGFGVSPGQAEGEVVVIHSPEDFTHMKQGAILVAPATDPAWTPLFTLAAGVIVEIGGIGSHASTVAREYGLPALANVKNATRLLQDGMRVRLDATRGGARHFVISPEDQIISPPQDLIG